MLLCGYPNTFWCKNTTTTSEMLNKVNVPHAKFQMHWHNWAPKTE